MSNSKWHQQLESMHGRVATLYRSAATESTQDELLPVAFEELQNALEELQAMQEELLLQHEHLLNTRERIEAEFQSYRDLFVHAPAAYLITGLNGTIRQANRAAATLFDTAEKFMIGRALALYVPEGERRAFRDLLTQISHSQHAQLWELRMQPWRGAPFQAALTTTVARGPLGHATAIRWIVQNMAARAQVEGQIHLVLDEPEERAQNASGNGVDYL